MRAIGLDIGTTTICGVLLDADTGEMQKRITLPNDTSLAGQGFEKLQDPKKIEAKVREIVQELESGGNIGGDIVSLGVTGQMHGILYLDAEGEAVSPLFTWQDGRGALLCRDGKSYVEELSAVAGSRLASGFGSVTHFYNTKNAIVTGEAVRFCTIADYIAMRLAGRKSPALHASMAASLGMFDMEEGKFDAAGIERAGMDFSYFPGLQEGEVPIDSGAGGVRIAPALGDNQASFLGSVNDTCSILVNVGTGGQISISGHSARSFPSLECRPFVGGQYLYVGSSLCGGYAYSLLKEFFQETFRMCGRAEERDLYEFMNAAGRKAREERKFIPGLAVDTRFQGSREKPGLRGRIEGISPENFTPGALTLGVLEGICGELFAFYREFRETEDGGEKAGSRIVGSGNGIRKNGLLREIISERFQKELVIPLYEEEAACGSALFSLYTAGVYGDLAQLRRRIRMEEPR